MQQSAAMELKCPTCQFKNNNDRNSNKNILKDGSYYRTSDRKRVQRYLCSRCLTRFSSSTLHDCYLQKKRHMNGLVARQLVAGISLRESARVLNLNRKTIARKMKFMAVRARKDLLALNKSKKLAIRVQFDDMETFEHTKCKPISVSLAIEAKSRRILGFEVAQMPAKGKLVHKSQRLYGRRKDHRSQARTKLFETLKPLVSPFAEITSDDNPHYPQAIKKHFPNAVHVRIKGGRSCATGQGELKKVSFDPIFSFNHTAAMARYRMSRLIRKTWCTSKCLQGIIDHFSLFAIFHNRSLGS